MKVTALAGGIGAAKFLLGLAQVIDPADVSVIANTGDDIELFGLRISPDVDTVTYTLAGVVSQERGWGLDGDTFEMLGWLGRYDSQSWFNLGDRDLATHIYRTHCLAKGQSLSQITDHIRRSLSVGSPIIPMTDGFVPTLVDTDEGEMHLQEYFVKRRCQPRVRGIRFSNVESCHPAPGVEPAVREADAIVICPSNPFISIGPILAVPGIRGMLGSVNAPVAAIAPIVQGAAVKGPTAEMLRDLGHEVSAIAVARMYQDIIDLFVLDERDRALAPAIEDLGMQVALTDTMMNSRDDKVRVARATIAAIEEVKGQASSGTQGRE